MGDVLKVPALEEGWTLTEPLQGLGQGKRLAELKKRRVAREAEHDAK